MFREQLKFGDEQQRNLEQWLVKNGCTVQPCNATPTGGARIYGPGGMEIANPDMMVFNAEHFNRRGQLGLFGTSTMAFVEVKAKRSFTFYRRDREWQTGIDAGKFDGYREIEAACGQTIWLFFLQLSGFTDPESIQHGTSPSGLYCQRLSSLLRGRRYTMKQRGRLVPMIYWAESALIKLCEIEEV